MVMIEEILECVRCGDQRGQAFADDQIGLLADGGVVQAYCPSCQAQTSWRYPSVHGHSGLNASPTDPLLETFQQRPPEQSRFVPRDPLLIGYSEVDADARRRSSNWDWFG